MPIPVLSTKLFAPPPRPNAVLRADLVARLNAGLHRKLTLISAPAGFGKTSLASAWIAGCGRPAAWLSLDEADTDPARFMTYLVAALQSIVPTVGADVIALLQSPQPPPIAALLPPLLNQIAMLPQPVILVLDDYHVLEVRSIDQTLAFLIEHLPPQLHLVITTREDPSLPLARLRARGHMTELRTADLRFTGVEAAAFLHQVMGLNLSAEDIAALEARTEGWIAGLQLAALSLQGQQDVSAFIQAFAGNHRYILDYLLEEVLQRQPKGMRSFLLQTSILERLHGALCDAVTAQESSNARLEMLERGNFFVIPLDDQRQWYRYHHLFAGVLSVHLRAEQPELVAILHQRASAWYEQQGMAPDAIRHALAAQDYERAANLVELTIPTMRRSRQDAMLLSWLKALPDELLQVRPILSIHYAGVLLSNGELADVEARLQDAERQLELMSANGECPYPSSATRVVRDAAEFRGLPGWIAVYRAGRALVLGDMPATVTYAQQALGLIAEEDYLGRGATMAILGLAYWTRGNLAAAYQTFADGIVSVQKAGYLSDTIGSAVALASIRITQGRLRDAMHTYERGLQLATAQGVALLRGTADMYVGMSELLREQNDLQRAIQHLQRSQELGEHMGLPQNPYRWHLAMARLREAEGDLDGALALLEEAEHRYVSDFFPNVCPITAFKTRVWVAQDRLDEALDWAHAQGLSAQDDLSYLREFEHITLARVLLACAMRDRTDQAMPELIGLLERLLRAAEAGERIGSVIEILVLQARSYQLLVDIPAALAALSRALILAKPEGYVRIFVDEGPSMAALLEQLKAGSEGLREYVARLLAAFSPEKARSLMPSTAIPRQLIEPLSERERDVLRLLRSDLDGPEMARELVISLNTLRTHTKNIFSKLGVNNRRAAVHRAEELGLF